MPDDPQAALSSDTQTPPGPGEAASPKGGLENRAAVRVNITWKGRLMLPPGTVLEVKTADISKSGVGLVGHQPLPAQTVLQLALQVPHPTIAGNFTVISGRVKVVFQVMRGGEFRAGAQWVELPDAYRALLSNLVERLAVKPDS